MATQGPSTYVINWADMRSILFPVSGAGTDVPVGTPLMRGVTAGTNKGVLIPITATSNAHGLGILSEFHDYSASGDALTATLTQWFPVANPGGSSYLNAVITGAPLPSHQVDLYDTATVVKMDYDLAATVAVASASTVTLTVTSAEADWDSGFVYVNAGTGIGQLLNIVSGTSGSIVLQTTPTVEPDNTSKLTKIMPLFYDTPVFKINTATVPTIIASTAAAGTGRAVNLANFICINGLSTRMDPKIYNQTNSLNSVSQLAMYSYLGFLDTALHPVS